MDTGRLRAFCTVVETGSLREAAHLLGISHGGLSKTLKVLERELSQAVHGDVDLLAPSGRGIVVTDAGRRLYRAAKKLIPDIDALAKIAAGAPSEAQPLRIGTFEVFSTYFLGELAEHDFPNAKLLVRELVPGAIEEAIAADEVDVGITYVPIPRVDVEFVRVASIEMATYGSVDRYGKMPWAEWPFCVPPIPIHGSPTLAKGLDGWPDDQLNRRVAHLADMMETGLELCRRGLAVIYLPAFVARLHNRWAGRAGQLESLPTPALAARPRKHVYVVKRRSTTESAAIRRIARALRRVTAARD